MGDGMDSDQEDSVAAGGGGPGPGNSWVVPRDHPGGYSPMYPLIPLHHSPTLGRPPRRGLVKARSYSPAASLDDSPVRSPRNKPVKHVRIKSAPTTPLNVPSKRTMNLNCCNGNQKSSEKSPGAEYQLMRGNDESSSYANNSSSFANDSSVFENNIRKNTDMDTDYLNNGNDNNNHEYVNVTEEMINELQRMRNESATSDENSTGLQNERAKGNGSDDIEVLIETEDGAYGSGQGEEPENDRVRMEPEGSESKEKLNVVKLDPLSSLPTSKKCMCNNPNCTDKLGERSPQAIRDLTPSPDPLTMNRDAWIGSTERNLTTPDDSDSHVTFMGNSGCRGGPYQPLSRQSNRREQFTKKKSFSVDADVLDVPEDDAYGRDASSSMPVLTIIDNTDRKPKNRCAQYPNGFPPNLNSRTSGFVESNSEALIANLDSNNVPYNSLQNKFHPNAMNYSDSTLSTIPRTGTKDNSDFNMGGSLGFLSINIAGSYKSPASSRGSHSPLNSPGPTIAEHGILRSFQIGGRVSPTTPELCQTEVRLTDSIPKVVLKQPSHEEEGEGHESQI